MQDAITTLVGQKTQLNKSDYKVCITALLGYTPADLEVDILFGQRPSLPLGVLKNVSKKNDDSNEDLELEAMEVFTALDRESKGFITVSDIEEVAREHLPLISSSHVCECFREVSEDNILTYVNFKRLYLNKS